jgi:prephenate dehydratase
MRQYLDKSVERMKMFRDYLDEVEKFPVRIGDAVMCPDNRVRLVKVLIREHGAQVSELLATHAVVIDNEHNETRFKVTELKKL